MSIVALHASGDIKVNIFGTEVYTEPNEDLGPADRLCDLVESQTIYPGTFECPPTNYGGPGTAAVVVHYVPNQPDRVTFCGWFLRKAMAAEANNKEWNTDKPVNGLRSLATRYSNQYGDLNLATWRNQRFRTLRRSGGLPDIDVSIGFDTFLTSVVG